MSSNMLKQGNDMERAAGSAASFNSMNDHLIVHKHHQSIGNPSAAGIFSFASSTFLLSLFNVSTRGVNTPNVVVGMAIFTGGLLQFIAGMWQYPRGEVFSATVFSCYGTFWMSYATILIPSTGIIASYSDPQEFSNAMGLYLMTWFVVTIIFILPTLRRNFGFTVLLSTLAIAFLLLAMGEFSQKQSLTKGGGIAGLITAILAFYMGTSELLAAEARPIMKLPQGLWYDDS